MKPPLDVEAKGLKAYEQAGAFERIRSWRLPLRYFLVSLVPVVNGIGMWRINYQILATLNFLTALFFALASWFHWKKLRARYTENLRLLAELKGKYGDQLPWIEVENHFAALEQLKRDLAEENEDGI